MLRIEKRLYFPNLIYQKEVRLNHPERKTKVPLYKLDWSYFETALRQKHVEWNKKFWPQLEVPFVDSLPEEYETWLKGLRFAISWDYIREIRRCTQRGVDEWNIERRFDTLVREWCLKPAMDFIWVAFKLLADCVFDEKTSYYMRNEGNPRRFIIPYASLYKLWMHQTGRGLVSRLSGVDKLNPKTRFMRPDNAEDKEWCHFYNEVTEHYKKIHDAYKDLIAETK